MDGQMNGWMDGQLDGWMDGGFKAPDPFSTRGYEAPSNPKTFVSRSGSSRPSGSSRNCRQAAKDRRDGNRWKVAALRQDGIRREKGYL